jgi:hypothetical protein
VGFLLGGFAVQGALQRGGTGQIWFGRHVYTQAPVAIKALGAPPEGASGWWPRLREEARAVAGLDHEAVVPVYDLLRAPEEAPESVRGRACMVMGYARHGSLGALRGALGWVQLAPLLRQALRGLAHVGARGLLHLDLKPENLLLTSAGGELGLWISDFGVGRRWGGEPDGGGLGGTRGYMAPELRRGDLEALGPWTDLYALGATACALLEGGQGRPELPSEVVLRAAGAPAGLRGWLSRALEEAPEARFGSAAEALRALEALEGALGVAPTLGALAARLPEDVAASGAASGAVEASCTLPVLRPLSPPPGARAPSPAGSMESWAPPLPEARRWRRLIAGASLHRDREPAMVGREGLRGALWGALPRIGEGARVCWLVGAEGIGKRRVARWLVEEAQAQGAARAAWLRPGAEGEEAALRAVAEALLRGPRGVAGELEGLGLEEYARGALWRLLGASAEPAGRPEELRGAVLALLRAAAARAPLVLALDATAREGEAAGYAGLQGLIAASRGAVEGLLWVVTGRAAPPAGGADQILTVPPLEEEELRALIEGRVGASEALIEALAPRAGGNPRWVVVLLQDWIDRGLLVEGPRGLTRCGEASLPEGLLSLWGQRAETLAARWASGALVAAALLAPALSAASVSRACAAARIEAPEALWEALEERGLLARGSARWRWLQPGLREALARRPEAAALRRACAEALRRGEGADAAQAAALLLDAGAPREALMALQEGSPRDLGAEASLALLERLEAALEGGEAERGWIQSWKAAALYLSGDSGGALALAGALPLEALEATPAAFDLLRFASAAALSRGQGDEADRYVAAVARVARRWPSPLVGLQAEVERARHALLRRRAPGDAVAILEGALGGASPPLARLTAEALLGVALREAGLLERAAAHNAAGAAAALRLGARALAHVFWNNQAEALRELGRLEEARGAYEASLKAIPDISPQTAYARINLATLEQGAGLWGQARARLEGLSGALGEARGVRVWLYLLLAQQVCEAADGDVARWEAQVGSLEEAAAAGGQWVPEAGALLRRAGALWRGRGREGLAVRAEALAARVG